MVDTLLHGEHGAAWRRRQRRLRSWWRHEQQSVAMALSVAAHHSCDKVAAGVTHDGLRAQKTDRAGEAAHRAPRRQRTRAAREAVIFELLDEDTAGLRPGVLAEPRPQERLPRHTMERIVDFACCAILVQTPDAPVPQTVEQLKTCSISSTRFCLFPSRSSKCPRSRPRTSPCARSCVLRSWQNSWWKCRRSSPFRRCSGLWSRTLTFQLVLVVELVEVFPVFSQD